MHNSLKLILIGFLSRIYTLQMLTKLSYGEGFYPQNESAEQFFWQSVDTVALLMIMLGCLGFHEQYGRQIDPWIRPFFPRVAVNIYPSVEILANNLIRTASDIDQAFGLGLGI